LQVSTYLKLSYLKLEESLAELLVKVDPELYPKFLSVENSRPIMYVNIKMLFMGLYRQKFCSGRP